ncbi:hypothetical protein BS78_02G087300 [Paspalum vaginatum]|nr:hypothetical protein BS78_02G087300 [Paspalum vaginatum]
MDDDAERAEGLAIMFTAVAVGLVVIIVGIFRIRSFISALMSGAVAAFWAWGLIRVKMLKFWLQRAGVFDQMFPLMQIHLFEIASYLMLLLILLFHTRPDQGMLRMVIKRLRHLARPSVRLYLVGLAITGYGMGVFFARGASPTTFYFFHGDFRVHFITIGLAVVIAGVWSHGKPVDRMAGVSLIVYIWLLLVATYTGGGWQ